MEGRDSVAPVPDLLNPRDAPIGWPRRGVFACDVYVAAALVMASGVCALVNAGKSV
jgi:hypothetical protein